MAKGRTRGGNRGGRPSALALQKRAAQAEQLRPMVGAVAGDPVVVSGRESLATGSIATFYGESRIVQGEAHFEARRAARNALRAALEAATELWRLGAYRSDDLLPVLFHISDAERRLNDALPPADPMPRIAVLLADEHPDKRWRDVEARALDWLASLGVDGAGDRHVLATAIGTSSADALKKRKQRRRNRGH